MHDQIALAEPSRLTLCLDLVERVAIVALFINFCAGFHENVFVDTDPVIVVLLIVESVMVALCVFRRPAATISTDPQDWAIAWLATCSPMLAVASDPAPLAPEAVCTIFVLCGVLFQLGGNLALNRRFGVVPANRGVSCNGPYVLVRHPIYLGYALTHVGFLLYAPSTWNAGVYLAAFALQIERILREERILRQDPAYHAYGAIVRWRLVPGVF